MLFIEGIGYVDETTYLNNTGKTTDTSTADFDNILSAETDKLNSQTNLDDIFREASETYNVSYDLLKAIAYNESGYRPDATSSVGAMGIMQLMPSTAQAMGVNDAYDPYQNIMGGAKLLSTLSDLYDGNQTLMIAAYNAGSGNVAKYGGVPPFSETQNYVAKVLSTLQSGTPDATLNLMNSTSGYMNSMLNTGSTDTLSSLLNTSDLYNNTDLSSSFSYAEYELLMQYYDNMLQIISSMGETDSSDEDSSDNSLLDLYKLGSLTYNQKNLNL